MSSTVVNATHVAIKLRRSIDSLYELISDLQEHATSVKDLRGRGSATISSNIVNAIATINDMKSDFIKDVNTLHGGYLEITYKSMLAEERRLAKQKRPIESSTNNPPVKKSRNLILTHPSRRKTVAVAITPPPSIRPTVLLRLPPDDLYYTQLKTC